MFFSALVTLKVAAAAAAAAAALLQSCPTLCDPIDSSPPGSPIPGIFQVRTRLGVYQLWKTVKLNFLYRFVRIGKQQLELDME